MSTNPWNETECEESQESPSSLFKLLQLNSSTGNQDKKKKTGWNFEKGTSIIINNSHSNRLLE